jgi:FKBP-type peptidyl-prolyl cis-trans isomerase FkpA
MKRVVACFAVAVMMIVSCGKKDSGCQPVPVVNERAQLIAYCNANGITYTEHTSGLFYQIIDPGTGVSPTTTSTVSVVYTGKHFDNSIFDAAANPVTFSLSGVIDGWKIGVPLLKKGGRIKLIIPSALAYSCTGSALPNGQLVIQPNEPLFFDITLTDVK